MKLIFTAFVLTFGISAFASDVVVDCSAPQGFSGQAAVIKGTLKKATKPRDGYLFVSGNLKIQIGGSTRNALYSKTVKVLGPQLDDGSLVLGSEKNPELSTIYVNTSRKDVSYVELDGKMFISNCVK
jgi:hypothetical protein